jgi:TRAP-type C4-dicarboxylate transport system substrate-binding protein
MSPLYPDFSVFGYPYIYEDYDHLLTATNPETSPPMSNQLDQVAGEANVRFLSMSILGTRHLGLTNVEACTPADLEDVDVRSPQLELFTKMVEGLGATPTNLDVSELISSMSSGGVQGWENTVNTMESFGIGEVQNYVIETEHMRFPVPMYMNLDTWDGMSSATQDVFTRAANDAAAWNASAIADIEAEAKSKLQDGGMTFVTTDGCLDLEAFRNSCRETVDEAFPEWASIAKEIENLA